MTRWDLDADGSLHGGATFAVVDPHVPDGMCVDHEGGVWLAGLSAKRVVRIHDGGAVSASVSVTDERFTIATVLGGLEGRHLFVATCATKSGSLTSWQDCVTASGFIEVVEVDVHTAGWPSN